MGLSIVPGFGSLQVSEESPPTNNDQQLQQDDEIGVDKEIKTGLSGKSDSKLIESMSDDGNISDISLGSSDDG